MASIDGLLLYLVENPGVYVLLACLACLVFFRLAFYAGLKLTVQRESRAAQIERTKEHAARAAHLRLVAKRMDESEVA